MTNPFAYHIYSRRRTYLGANATTFAVFKVYLDKRSLANNRFWAIEPALKTGKFI
jgi:hypothetical protein